MNIAQPTSPFDEFIERRGTNCDKWDAMNKSLGVDPEDGLAMWVADMDFRPPSVVTDRLRGILDHGMFGYADTDTEMREAVRWWMQTRHGWSPDVSHIISTHGLVSGIGMCLDAFTEPGDGIVLFTPVYHAFSRVIKAAGRRVVECPLVEQDGRYSLDLEAYDAAMTGAERMVILCSPHNPGGTVWRRDELEAVAAFAKRHDLILISDEVHHDLVYPGERHTPMALIDGVQDRLVMMTAATKTFNLAGVHLGQVTIADEDLRTKLKARMRALSLGPGALPPPLIAAAYSPGGAEWVDALMQYLETSRQVFDDGVNAIPGLRSMRLQGTYLSWVDFSGTGMETAEIEDRVLGRARIAANRGPTFGSGGQGRMRFNLATPRARIFEAVERLKAAFSDLQ